jgi:hypothetical protein
MEKKVKLRIMIKLSRKTIMIVSVSIILLLIMFTITYVVLLNQTRGYTEHGPITILKDEDFEYYNFPGKGTAKKPYLIQNLNITADQTDLIYISGTTKHFVIQNCYLSTTDPALDPQEDLTSIYISDAAENTARIAKNTLNGTCYGIKIYNSIGVTIENNAIDILPTIWWAGPYPPNANSIILDNCSFSTIENNNCYDGPSKVYSSENSTIVGNSFFNGGISVRDSKNTIISKNFFYNSGLGYIYSPNTTSSNNTIYFGDLGMSYSPYSVMENNVIFNGGYSFNEGFVGLMYDSTITVENNYVNDKPLGYFITEQKITISAEQFGQLFFFDCSEIIVKNQVIHDVNTGMTFHECGTIQLSNNSINSSNRGVHISFADKLEVINNHLNYNDYAIEARGGMDSMVVNSTCNFNFQAMKLDEFDNLQIENNTLLNNTCGIDVDDITNSTIRNNILTSDGIFYNPGFFGISVTDSDSIVIDQNSMLARFTDIRFLESANLTLTNNVLIESFIKIEKKYLSTYTIINNTINDKQFGVFYDEENLTINSPDYGQLFLLNCSNFNISNQFMGLHTLVVDSFNVSFNNCSWMNFFRTAIAFVNSVNCNITNSTVISNPIYRDMAYYDGIDISNSSFCTISYTLIKYCMGSGLVIDRDSYNNTIHHNAFVENALYTFSNHQAEDYGYNNTWYDITKLEGNYWFDYDLSGSYSIWGNAGSEDLYPLLTNPL